MSNWFEDFAGTPVGLALSEIIDTPERYLDFLTMTENRKPAVQAIGREVAPIINALPTKQERNAASQFCGWRVGQIMRSAGYEIVQDRGRVSDSPFQTGAVWKQVGQDVRLVKARPSVSGPGVVELKVELDNSGAVVGERTVTMTAKSPVTGAVRRVHIIGGKMPIIDACKEALGYAKRMGISSVWVDDPDRLFPSDQWPAFGDDK